MNLLKRTPVTSKNSVQIYLALIYSPKPVIPLEVSLPEKKFNLHMENFVSKRNELCAAADSFKCTILLTIQLLHSHFLVLLCD